MTSLTLCIYFIDQPFPAFSMPGYTRRKYAEGGFPADPKSGADALVDEDSVDAAESPLLASSKETAAVDDKKQQQHQQQQPQQQPQQPSSALDDSVASSKSVVVDGNMQMRFSLDSRKEGVEAVVLKSVALLGGGSREAEELKRKMLANVILVGGGEGISGGGLGGGCM